MTAFPLPLMSRFGPGRIIHFSLSHILDRIPNYVVLQPIHDSKWLANFVFLDLGECLALFNQYASHKEQTNAVQCGRRIKAFIKTVTHDKTLQ